MSFINVTISTSKKIGEPVFVYAGEDISTFCPLTITLDATVISGNPVGATFIWEQVLRYQYLSVNYGAKQFTFAGNIAGSFYSNREVVELILENQVVAVFSVASAIYNGTNTIVTVLDTLSPLVVPAIAILQHAGSATNSSFSWNTPATALTAVFTPTVSSDKVFRIWSNRGKVTQRYNDTEVILTPRDRWLMTPQLVNAVQVDNPCQQPVARIFTIPPGSYGQAGDSEGPTANTWTMTWFPPTCFQQHNLVRYIVQTSCNGGDTWTTIGTPTGVDNVSITTGCAGRVAAVYSILGTNPFNVQSPELSANAFVVHWSNTVFAGTYSPETLYSAMSTFRMGLISTLIYEPITGIAVSGVVQIGVSDGAIDDYALGAPIPSINTFDPITSYLVTLYTLLLLPDAPELTDDQQISLISTNISPITNFTVTGSGTIGG